MHVKPKDIDTSQHFWGAFGKTEREISARWITRFCQARGSWDSFTYDELNEWCKANGHKGNFWFNGLDTGGFGIGRAIASSTGNTSGDDVITIRPYFVGCCHKASPACVREREHAASAPKLPGPPDYLDEARFHDAEAAASAEEPCPLLKYIDTPNCKPRCDNCPPAIGEASECLIC